MSLKSVLAIVVFVIAVMVFGTTRATAQDASVHGHGTYGTTTSSYNCPSIAVFSHGMITFDLQVSSKDEATGEATGTFRATCMGFSSRIDSTPIITIVEITETKVSVRGLYDLERAGYTHCADKAGNAMSRIYLDIQLQIGAAGTLSPPTIHVSSAVPPGGISCRDLDSGGAVVFQNFDGGVQPLASGSISVTPYHRASSN